MSDGGKGSSPRPFSVNQDQFASNWDSIFGKKKKTEAEKFDEAIMKPDFTEDTRVTSEGVIEEKREGYWQARP